MALESHLVPRQTKPFPRYLAARLREALADTPAVLIHGPRQSGKTTLARTVGEPRGYRYVSFDDEAVQDAARHDPIGFVERLPRRTILDEVQRVPEIFTSLKAVIDRRRRPGRFILTGSANVLLVPHLADSLAGRMGILRLHPLAQCELHENRPRFIETLFRGGFRTRITDRLGPALAERMVGGGYPAALAGARRPGGEPGTAISLRRRFNATYATWPVSTLWRRYPGCSRSPRRTRPNSSTCRISRRRST